MQRTKKPKPSAILTADWHLREDQPTCRTDDFWTAQWQKVDAISSLQKRYGCSVIHAGDLFETKNPVMSWKPSPYLLSTAIKHLPEQFWTVYGNHDLPQHSLEQKDKCGVEVLEAAGVLKVLKECHWGEIPNKESLFLPTHPNRDVLVWHVMTFPEGTSPWPGCTDLNGQEILKKYPQFDLVCTGHNHATFVEEQDGRLLVNPGSLTRQDADQEDHIPCVFLWYAQTNTVKKVLLPFEKDVITREHLDKPKERRERLEAYIERMSSGWKAGLDFPKNLEIHFKENPTPKQIQELVWNSMN